MAEDAPDPQKLAKDRTEWAENRTDWAEDRTIMANERTFAGWMRTGLAAIGIGLGFRALFRVFDPDWVPKAIATLFIVIGIVVIAAAYQAAVQLQYRLNAHSAEPASRWRMGLIAILMIIGAIGLGIVMWLL